MDNLLIFAVVMIALVVFVGGFICGRIDLRDEGDFLSKVDPTEHGGFPL